MGELVVLRSLCQQGGTSAVMSWVGPEGSAQDFVNGRIALEVKASTQAPHCPTITSFEQLDARPFETPYLACVLFRRNEAGESLSSIVSELESMMAADDSHLETFWGRLATAGYRRELTEQYQEHAVSTESTDFFEVNELFPAITVQQLTEQSVGRVLSCKYTLSLAGLPSTSLDDPKLERALSVLRSW